MLYSMAFSYTFDVSRDIVKAGSDIKAYLTSAPEGIPDEMMRATAMRDQAPQIEIPKASWADFWGHYSQWKYGKVLLGTAGSWFFLVSLLALRIISNSR